MTYSSLVAGLAAMTVTGVTRKYTSPPSQISSADIPSMYPRLPEGNQEIVTFSYQPGMIAASCELVIVIKANMQGTAAANFGECLTLLDALNSALNSNAAALRLDRWTLRQDSEFVGDSVYWSIVARVEASE